MYIHSGTATFNVIGAIHKYLNILQLGLLLNHEFFDPSQSQRMQDVSFSLSTTSWIKISFHFRQTGSSQEAMTSLSIAEINQPHLLSTVAGYASHEVLKHVSICNNWTYSPSGFFICSSFCLWLHLCDIILAYKGGHCT